MIHNEESTDERRLTAPEIITAVLLLDSQEDRGMAWFEVEDQTVKMRLEDIPPDNGKVLPLPTPVAASAGVKATLRVKCEEPGNPHPASMDALPASACDVSALILTTPASPSLPSPSQSSSIASAAGPIAPTAYRRR